MNHSTVTNRYIILSFLCVLIPFYYYYCPQTEFGQGNVFRSMCQSFCPQKGGSPSPGQRPRWTETPRIEIPWTEIPLGQRSPLERAPTEQRCPWTEIPPSSPKMATAADGMHPTGTHSCYYYDWICYTDIRIIILNFVLQGKLSVLEEFILINRIQFCCDEWCYIFIKR